MAEKLKLKKKRYAKGIVCPPEGGLQLIQAERECVNK